MSFLAVLDIFNYFMEGLIFLALAAAFWQACKNLAAADLASRLVGIAVSFSTNISMTMFSFSLQYIWSR